MNTVLLNTAINCIFWAGKWTYWFARASSEWCRFVWKAENAVRLSDWNVRKPVSVLKIRQRIWRVDGRTTMERSGWFAPEYHFDCLLVKDYWLMKGWDDKSQLLTRRRLSVLCALYMNGCSPWMKRDDGRKRVECFIKAYWELLENDEMTGLDK